MNKSSMRSSWSITVAVLLVAATTSLLRAAEPDPAATRRLARLIDQEWERRLKQQPTFASYLGDRRHNDRWPDVSLEAIQRRHLRLRSVLQSLEGIDRNKLSPDDQLNLDLFRHEHEVSIESYRHRWFLVPLTARDGIQDASSTADVIRFETLRDFEQWLSRLKSFGTYMDQTISLMKTGLKEKRVHDREVMERVPAQILRQIVEDPERSLFFKPFRRFPDSVSQDDQRRLSQAARQAISDVVVPAYRRFHEFFTKEYMPGCFARAGVWQIPKGKEFYAFRCRRFTTTDMTPGEIHRVGLAEVKRIRSEMDKVIARVKFKGSFREFLEFMRNDSRFYFKDANDLLAAYRAVSKRIDPHLVRLFRKLPRIPYGVEPIPMHLAPDTTAAYYRPPSADGLRAGTYFVNLYRPEMRPKYEIEALSLHEAVPGHHLQISLAMELNNVPPFRRFGGYTAFIEGWGLYAESLGSELGLYKDPYSRFGQLTYEMWRAVRLVVDTGMHHDGWTRQQAIDYFIENTAKTQLDIENEVDRYIAWPGQALAYKIGELKIQALRRQAEESLGDDFDIREFHDVVLSRGAVTLKLLSQQVEAWIASRRSEAPKRR